MPKDNYLPGLLMAIITITSSRRIILQLNETSKVRASTSDECLRAVKSLQLVPYSELKEKPLKQHWILDVNFFLLLFFIANWREKIAHKNDWLQGFCVHSLPKTWNFRKLLLGYWWHWKTTVIFHSHFDQFVGKKQSNKTTQLCCNQTYFGFVIFRSLPHV